MVVLPLLMDIDAEIEKGRAKAREFMAGRASDEDLDRAFDFGMQWATVVLARVLAAAGEHHASQMLTAEIISALTRDDAEPNLTGEDSDALCRTCHGSQRMVAVADGLEPASAGLAITAVKTGRGLWVATPGQVAPCPDCAPERAIGVSWDFAGGELHITDVELLD